MGVKILFIGDSITEGFDTENYLGEYDIENKAVSGDASVETLERLNDKWFEDELDYVFICIGTNDFARGFSDEYILENIREIVKYCKSKDESAEVVLTSLFPTRFNKARPNARIRKFNQKLADLSKELGTNFFDIHDFFTDESKRLKIPYTTDGLHLSDDAYREWAELVKNYLH